MLDLINDPPAGFRAEPLFISGAGARYARKFTLAALGCEPDLLDDDPVEAVQGDVYLRLDSCFDIDADAIEFYRQMRWRGVKLYFVIDDLQPVLAPHVFSDEFAPLRARRLEQVAEVADGFLCAARDVAEELTVWLEQKRPARLRPLKLGLLPAAFTVTNLSKATGMKGDAAAARTSAASADPIENYISRGDWCAVWPKRHGVS